MKTYLALFGGFQSILIVVPYGNFEDADAACRADNKKQDQRAAEAEADAETEDSKAFWRGERRKPIEWECNDAPALREYSWFPDLPLPTRIWSTDLVDSEHWYKIEEYEIGAQS